MMRVILSSFETLPPRSTRHSGLLAMALKISCEGRQYLPQEMSENEADGTLVGLACRRLAVNRLFLTLCAIHRIPMPSTQVLCYV